MKGANDNLYLWLLVCANFVALLQLLAAIKWPRVARLSFFLLFTWACFTNWNISRLTPEVYLEYADLTWSSWYRQLINGWFSHHTRTVVGFIAVAQGFIALSMLARGTVFRVGLVGGIIFLLAILPLGVGAGFPCTGIMAAALFILLKKRSTEFIWIHPLKNVA
jgi:hypothetical protein